MKTTATTRPTTTRRRRARPLPDPAQSRRRIRNWMLRKYPREAQFIGDFNCTATFADLNRAMHNGEDFYEFLNCTESAERELVFEEMSRIYGTDYGYWYDLWLEGGR